MRDKNKKKKRKNDEYGSHPNLPLWTSRVKRELKGVLVSTLLPVQMTGEMADLYIHSHTCSYTQVNHRLSSMSTLPPISMSLCLTRPDLYMEGLTEVNTQSPDAQTQRIGSPLGWPSWSNGLPLSAPWLSCGLFRGRLSPFFGPWVYRSSASAAGQHDKPYMALSNTWLTHPRLPPPVHPHSQTNYPKTQTDDHLPPSYFLAFAARLNQSRQN